MGHRDHGAAVRPSPSSGDVVAQIGHPNAMRATGHDSGLDRRADVIGVDVDIPEPASPDDHDGITELGQC